MNTKELYVPILIIWTIVIVSITLFEYALSGVFLAFASFLYADLVSAIIEVEKTDENKKVPIGTWRFALASPIIVPFHALFIGLPDVLRKRN